MQRSAAELKCCKGALALKLSVFQTVVLILFFGVVYTSAHLEEARALLQVHDGAILSPKEKTSKKHVHVY